MHEINGVFAFPGSIIVVNYSNIECVVVYGDLFFI